MKVIYKIPIWKKIEKEKKIAENLGEEIEYIVLNMKEKKELIDFVFSSIDYAHYINCIYTKEQLMNLKDLDYCDIQIRFED